MAWIIISILFAIFLVVGWVVAEFGETAIEKWVIRGGATAVIIILWSIMTLALSVKQVDVGNVGLVYEFGNIVDTRDPGLSLIKPWAKMKQANVQVQAYQTNDKCSNGQEHCIEAATKDQQNLFITGTMNYSLAECSRIDEKKCSVDKQDIIDLFRQVGSNYVEKVIAQRFLEVPKALTANDENGYQAKDVLNRRSQLSADIAQGLREALATDSRFKTIHVISYVINNVSFDEGYNNKVKETADARQQIDVEIQNVEVAKQQAEKAKQAALGEANAAIERATGDASARRIAADAEAYSNNTINNSLTPLLIQRLAINKVVDKIQIALVPDNGGFFLDPSKLFNPTTAAP